MTLHRNLLYKYRETKLTLLNYEEELENAIFDFFSNIDIDDELILIDIIENGRELRITIRDEYVDTDVLKEHAKAFAKQFDIDFVKMTKFFVYNFVNWKETTTLDGYQLLFSLNKTIA